MTKFIFRKPEFMRSDIAMRSYFRTAEVILEEANKTTIIEERYYFLKKADECIDEAAKAGGFLSTKDFFKWFKNHRTLS